jgi:hypothetical protein
MRSSGIGGRGSMMLVCETFPPLLDLSKLIECSF